MTKKNPSSGNKTKPGIISWSIFKSDMIFHWSQNNEIKTNKNDKQVK